jgi:hypothetical protein
MSKTPSPPGIDTHDLPVPLRESVYRYFFYGWLFRDGNSGSGLERAAALRHNREQAKWLPIYFVRWVICGSVLLVLENLCQRTLSSPVLSAALAVALILVVLFLFITAICWLFLHKVRQTR